MKCKKILVAICTLLLVTAIGVGVHIIYQELESVESDVTIDFNAESLRWTIIGAVGGWVGSIFGAIALVVSLVALWFPQRVKIKVSVSVGMLLDIVIGEGNAEVYTVTIINSGMRPVTVNNIYLHFGRRQNFDIYLGKLNENTKLQAYDVSFPIRLNQGESFNCYLAKDKLDEALNHYEKDTPRDTALSIRVDEVMNGSRYYKTNWTLGSFIGNN